MVDTTSIRNKIANKLFTGLGSTGTIYNISTSTTDKWGDATVTYSSGTSVTLVPWNYMYQKEEDNPFGELTKGEVDIAVPYGTTVSSGDKITYNSKDYVVRDVEKFELKDALLVIALRLAEII